jgi:PAS domain S-box-containing protein
MSREAAGGGSASFEPAVEALLESTEALAEMGSWDWDLGADRLHWSDNLYRIFGLEPGAITPTSAYVFEQAHPDDREHVESEVESMKRSGALRPLAYRIVRPDGDVRHLLATTAVVEEVNGKPRRVVGSVQDVTDRRRAERTIAAHLAVAKALTGWQSFEQGATELLRGVAENLDCLAGALWLPEGDVLAAQVTWRTGSAGGPELESVIRQLRLPRGVGLAGQVWERAEPATLTSIEDDPRFSAEAVTGLRGVLGLPAIHAQEVLAVLELYFCDTIGVDGGERSSRSLTSIGYELGEFLAHRRGELKPSALTPRELEVLQLAAQGCSGRQIAERLVLSPATVRRHFEHIYAKYGVSDRAAAVAKALREGLIK